MTKEVRDNLILQIEALERNGWEVDIRVGAKRDGCRVTQVNADLFIAFELTGEGADIGEAFDTLHSAVEAVEQHVRDRKEGA